MLAKVVYVLWPRSADPNQEAATRERFLGRVAFVDGVLEGEGPRAQQLNIGKSDWEAGLKL